MLITVGFKEVVLVYCMHATGVGNQYSSCLIIVERNHFLQLPQLLPIRLQVIPMFSFDMGKHLHQRSHITFHDAETKLRSFFPSDAFFKLLVINGLTSMNQPWSSRFRALG